jgi:hypothetical protein
VRRAEQFILGETADFDKDMICERDPAGWVGAGYQRFIARDFGFNGGDRLVDSHMVFLLAHASWVPPGTTMRAQESTTVLTTC